MLGERYTLLDMAVWGWANAVPFAIGENAWKELPNVKRLVDTIDARPGGTARSRDQGPPRFQDRERRRGATCNVSSERASEIVIPLSPAVRLLPIRLALNIRPRHTHTKERKMSTSSTPSPGIRKPPIGFAQAPSDC